MTQRINNNIVLEDIQKRILAEWILNMDWSDKKYFLMKYDFNSHLKDIIEQRKRKRKWILGRK